MRPPAKRRLGQHFLHDPRLLGRIAAAAGAGPGDTVLEIGPGHGGLTGQLLAGGASVVAIEKDADLVPGLRKRLPGVTVVEGDALELDWHALAGRPSPERWVVTGNIPYNITSPLLQKALTPPLPRSAVFLVQREVADRLAAAPGTRAYGALTVGVAAVAAVERLFGIPAGAFVPAPRVDSAVVRLTPRPAPLIAVAELANFRRFTTALFGFRRKQFRRALRELTGWPVEPVDAALAGAGLDAAARPETAGPERLVALYRGLVDRGWSGH